MTTGKQVFAALGALALIDWRFAAAVALGFVSGWMVRAAQQIEKDHSIREILRGFVISLLISGGGLITVLYLTKDLRENFEAVAAISFLVAWQGFLAVTVLRIVLSKSMGFGLWLWEAVDRQIRLDKDRGGSEDRLRWTRRPPPPDPKLQDLARRLDEPPRDGRDD